MNRDGFYGKYRVERSDREDRPGGRHHGCEYFVLDMTCDPAAVPAIEAYAVACRERRPRFAQVLLAWVAKKKGDPTLEMLKKKRDQAMAAMTEKEKEVFRKVFGYPAGSGTTLPVCRTCNRTIVWASPDGGLCGPCYNQREGS